MVAKAAVVITVLNEAENIATTLKSLKEQDTPLAEVIVVDGGSTDNTLSILKAYTKSWPKLKIFSQPGSRSVCRNFGVSQTHSSIIAFTDAGCIPHSDWLTFLLAPFSDPSVEVVSGYYQGVWKNIFQKSLIPFVLVMPDVAGKSEFLPSTRSMALRRSVWTKAGGFDPALRHNEDYAFAWKLKYFGYSFTFAPKALVDWTPRNNLKEAAWMFMRFAIGDIEAGIIRPQVKHLAYRYIGAIFLFFLALQFPILFYPLLILILLYLLLSIKKNIRYVKDIQCLFWLPVIQLTADFSVMFGSLVGLLSKVYGLL